MAAAAELVVHLAATKENILGEGSTLRTLARVGAQVRSTTPPLW